MHRTPKCVISVREYKSPLVCLLDLVIMINTGPLVVVAIAMPFLKERKNLKNVDFKHQIHLDESMDAHYKKFRKTIDVAESPVSHSI